MRAEEEESPPIDGSHTVAFEGTLGTAGTAQAPSTTAPRTPSPTMRATSAAASSTESAGLPSSHSPAAASEFDTRATRGLSTPISRSRSPCENTFRGVSSNTSFPWSSTTTRLQYSESNATFCSITTTVMPANRFTSHSVSNTSVEDTGSSAAVGSSSTRTRGRNARIAAMATFCFWPPESVAISRSRKSSMPTVSSACCIRAGISSCVTPKFSSPNSNSSRTFDATN